MVMVNDDIVFADVYLRYSSHKQDDGNSIEYQMEDVNRYCEQNGIVVREWYIDRALSAKETAGRDEFYRYVDDVKDGRASGIFLVWRTNRAFRNSYESHKYRKMFREKGIKYVSVTQSIDEDTSSGRLITSVMSDIDQYKSEEISEHVSSALRVMVKDGFFTGGKPPFGYDLVEVSWNGKPRKRLIPNKEEAALVREVFERVADGASIRGTQLWLAGTGFLSRKGKPFAHSSVQDMLKNTTYIGTRTHRSKIKGNLVIENSHPAIVDVDLFEKVQEVLAENKKKTQGRARTERVYALTGKMVCGKCGTPMHGWTSSPYQYYVCGCTRKDLSCRLKRIRKDFIEKEVYDLIRDGVLSDEAIETITNSVLQKIKKSPTKVSDKKALLKRKESLLQEIAETVKLKAAGHITLEQLIYMKSPQEEEVKQINYKLKEIELLFESNMDAKRIKETVKKLFAPNIPFEQIDGEVLKELVNRTVEKVVVTDTQVDIFLRVAFGRFLFNGGYTPLYHDLNKNIER